MSGFVHLHVHTEYSLLSGACRIKQLIKKAKSQGQSALAITDSGAMFGCIDFYDCCMAEGIKPILGCELYIAPKSRHDKTYGEKISPYHITLLCENNTGYYNLMQLVSIGYTEGWYYIPRIDKELLKQYHEGIIALSGCGEGEIPRLIEAGNYRAAVKTAQEYREIFGKNNFFLELNDQGLKQQKEINSYLLRLSSETGIPVAATNNVHYIEKEDSYVHNVLTCIDTGTSISDGNDKSCPTEEYYLKTEQEMKALFPTKAIENTVKIADRCNVTIEYGHTVLPYFKADGWEDNNQYFDYLVKQGLLKRYGENPSAEAIQRAKYETDVIRKMGYIDYFLIVADFISYAKSKGIAVGPGRGSGAGSICAYCLGITDIDPLEYQLLFERFLNPERVSMPDFDIDFCYRRRQEVIDYVIAKYGRDKVAQIITFGTMAARAAIRDSARVMGLPYSKGDSAARLIPFAPHSTIDGALKSEKALQRLSDSDQDIKRLLDTARKIEGMPRNTSVHAAGIVITREPVTEYVPLYTNGDETVTQYTMTALERLGLLKMDFLGLRYLTVIQDCCKLIQQTDKDFDIEKIDLSDKEVYNMMSSGGTGGIFQFESDGMTSLLSRLKPHCIEDLVAALALYRPGPMDSIPKYIANRKNPEKIVYKHPLLKDILDVTYGCIVYQEQVMSIFRVLGGYSYGRADIVRRAMAKKKQAEMERERAVFIAGAVKNGVEQAVANEIFDDMASFASYAFNKSHAAAYAVLSYRTAYLRCHYYKEYMAALLTSVMGQTAKTADYIQEMSRKGVKLLPPHVNYSMAGFSLEPEGIRFGLEGIKNLGTNVINAIIEKRQHGKFTTLTDFCSRMAGTGISRRAVDSLIKSGALDNPYDNRREMVITYELIMDDVLQSRDVEGQMNLFEGADGHTPEMDKKITTHEFTLKDRLLLEKEMLGVYISAHPSDSYDKTGCKSVADILLRGKDRQRAKVTATMIDKRDSVTKAGTPISFLKLEDKTGELEGIMFADAAHTYYNKLTIGEVYTFGGKVTVKDDFAPQLIIETADVPKLVADEKTLYIQMPDRNDSRLEELKLIMSRSPGNTRVVVCFKNTREKVSVPRSKYVNITSNFMKLIENLCGNDNIILK